MSSSNIFGLITSSPILLPILPELYSSLSHQLSPTKDIPWLKAEGRSGNTKSNIFNSIKLVANIVFSFVKKIMGGRMYVLLCSWLLGTLFAFHKVFCNLKKKQHHFMESTLSGESFFICHDHDLFLTILVT